ncbi:MAG: hypothetical protein KA015_00025 [Spirochaetes bacterium]|nr:hypothetical protein [Spirochaetota bacterium]
MKIITYITIALIAFSSASAKDIKATTEDGKTIILSENGTWKYDKKAEEKKTDQLVTQQFNTPADSTSIYNAKRGNFTIKYNPSKWEILSTSLNQMAEASFQHSSGDAYGMIITERIRIPMENFESIVVDNAQKAATNVEITKSEIRLVNGKQVKFIELTGIIQGINFVYNYYVYSDSKGSTQITLFTSKELYPEYKLDFENFLNGFNAK